MVSLRDPLRDTLAFADFAQSLAIACVVLAAASLSMCTRMFSQLSFVPLLGALALSLALILFGTGPGLSDAKVNLFGFQPVEFIKILIVLFLAGYFAQRWEFLRVLKERRPELGEYLAPHRDSTARIHPAGPRWRWRCCWCSSSCRKISDPRC